MYINSGEGEPTIGMGSPTLPNYAAVIEGTLFDLNAASSFRYLHIAIHVQPTHDSLKSGQLL